MPGSLLAPQTPPIGGGVNSPMDSSFLFNHGASANGFGQPHGAGGEGTAGMMAGQLMMGHAMGGPMGMCGPAHLQPGLPHSSSSPMLFPVASSNSLCVMEPGSNVTPSMFPIRSPSNALLEIPDLTNLSDNNIHSGGPLGLTLRKSSSLAELISGQIRRKK
jgi:hypothetical protein